VLIQRSLKAIFANRLKSFLIFLTLTFSIVSIFLISAISSGVIGMYSNILKSDADIIITQAKISDTFFSNVDINLTNKIKQIDGIKKVSALIVGASPVEELPIVAIYGVTNNRFENYNLISGDYPKQNQALIGKSIYNKLKNKNVVNIGDNSFDISGVYGSKIGFENGGVVLPIAKAGKIFNKSSSMILVNCDVSMNISKIISKIENITKDIEAKETNSFIDNYNQFKIIQTSSNMVSSIAFFMGLLSIASIMSITIYQRQDEFGILKALGISSSKIIFSLIIESLIIAIFSFVIALGLSLIFLEIIEHIDAFQSYVSGQIDFYLAITVFFTSIVMTILGAFLPSYKASKIDPIILIQRGNN
jgi:ABC-type antimicrobial peptide transport system permease subunit